MTRPSEHPTGPLTFDLGDAPTEPGDGVHWTLDRPGSDLNANLVQLDPGHVAEEHVNRDVDVFLVVVDGSGSVHVDGERFELHEHVVAHVPRGASRRVGAGPNGLRFLTVHRRRRLGIRTASVPRHS